MPPGERWRRRPRWPSRALGHNHQSGRSKGIWPLPRLDHPPQAPMHLDDPAELRRLIEVPDAPPVGMTDANYEDPRPHLPPAGSHPRPVCLKSSRGYRCRARGKLRKASATGSTAVATRTRRRPLPHRDHPGPLPARTRLPRTENERRQERRGSAPLPQPTPGRVVFNIPQSESRLDIGATPAQAMFPLPALGQSVLKRSR
jgi:hypothetical protein